MGLTYRPARSETVNGVTGLIGLLAVTDGSGRDEPGEMGKNVKNLDNFCVASRDPDKIEDLQICTKLFYYLQSSGGSQAHSTKGKQ